MANGAVITLPKAGRGARGVVKDGQFELGTYGNTDGAVIGTHQIAVSATEQSKENGPEAKAGKSLIPERYTNPATSGLTIEVKADGANTPELKLTTP